VTVSLDHPAAIRCLLVPFISFRRL
jgi:hypothetical protein